jgi:hypothetical protein
MAVERRFDWDAIGRQQKSMYEELMGNAATGV